MSSKSFSFADYDCIGFDLDNTICQFHIKELMKLEYELLSHHLVKLKGYDPKHILKPFEMAADFVLKGLTMDFDRGNILRLGPDGTILKASHGTKPLTDEDIVRYYGKEKKWECAVSYTNDPLAAWNTSLESKIRTCLDYFDIPAIYCFANCINAIDAVYGPQTVYNVYPDILECLILMFTRENFSSGKGGFFGELKSNIDKYYKKCDDSVIKWMKELKKNKKLFLITGSNVDFASFTAKNCMGEDWLDLFDGVIFYARKPGFFSGNRFFMGIKDLQETNSTIIDPSNEAHVYSQGNWNEFHKLLSNLSGKSDPKILYIGDNLIQDVYAPSKYNICDTVAVAEEMAVDVENVDSENNPYATLLLSKVWGSFFSIDVGGNKIPSFWSKIVKDHSKICIPSLKSVACNPIDYKYKTFTDDDCMSGFYPNVPISLK